MQTYMVKLSEGSSIDLKSEYPNAMDIGEGVWILADQKSTCAEVSDKIGIGKNNLGVVVEFSNYYGFFDNSLWQKIDKWRKENGQI